MCGSHHTRCRRLSSNCNYYFFTTRCYAECGIAIRKSSVNNVEVLWKIYDDILISIFFPDNFKVGYFGLRPPCPNLTLWPNTGHSNCKLGFRALGYSGPEPCHNQCCIKYILKVFQLQNTNYIYKLYFKYFSQLLWKSSTKYKIQNTFCNVIEIQKYILLHLCYNFLKSLSNTIECQNL